MLERLKSGLANTGALLLVAAALAIDPASLPASQDWSGERRLRGVVLDAGGRPLEGARISLVREGGLHGPPATRSDAKGRWRLSGLSPGAWRITIEAEAHITSNGRVLIPASGRPPTVRVQLRSLGEVSSLGSEGSPSAIVQWLEKGDSLLRHGRYAEARVEYERALGELPPTRRAEILEQIARTYSLEGNHQRAAEVLRQATAEPQTDAVQPPSASLAQRPERPLLPPEAHRAGRYRTTFDGRSPLASLLTFSRRTGIDPASIKTEDPNAGTFRLEDESFELYVPSSYRRETPHGLFVWVSPVPFGGVERPETLALLDELRLIWVGANHSGNQRPRWDRYALALEAAHHVQRLYSVDPERLYIGGYSGGGRIASGLAMLYAEVFRGGFFLFGCDHYRDLPLPDRPGAHRPATFNRPPSSSLKRLKRRHRFVLLTGELDFNRLLTRSVYEALREEGFRHVTYLEIPGASHYQRVEPAWLERGFRALDGGS